MSSLNLSLPTSWQQLSDKQLRFVFFLLSSDYTLPQLKTLCLLKWGNLRVDHREGAIFILRRGKHFYPVSATQISEATNTLNWLADIPVQPVRLSRIGVYRAFTADFQELPFGDFISLDNLYQGYLQTKNDQLLQEMGRILYRAPRIRLTKLERLSIFYWFASVKQMFARMFRCLFKSVSNPDEPKLLSFQQLQDAMNAQIRALTNGDITKEKAVLSLDTWRALTELDAKARDFEQMKKSRPA